MSSTASARLARPRKPTRPTRRRGVLQLRQSPRAEERVARSSRRRLRTRAHPTPTPRSSQPSRAGRARVRRGTIEAVGRPNTSLRVSDRRATLGARSTGRPATARANTQASTSPASRPCSGTTRSWTGTRTFGRCARCRRRRTWLLSMWRPKPGISTARRSRRGHGRPRASRFVMRRSASGCRRAHNSNNSSARQQQQARATCRRRVRLGRRKRVSKRCVGGRAGGSRRRAERRAVRRDRASCARRHLARAALRLPAMGRRRADGRRRAGGIARLYAPCRTRCAAPSL